MTIAPSSSPMCYLLPGEPAQIGFACCQSLIQAAYHGCMWGSFDDLRVGARLFGNLFHHVDEVVEGFTGFRLGRFDHQRFMHDQWEVGGWGVHAEIEQAFGDIKGCDAALVLLALGCSDELVLARLWISNV